MGINAMISALAFRSAGSPASVQNGTSYLLPVPAEQSTSTTGPLASDELSISDPGARELSEATYERMSLRLRSRTQTRVTDDGQVRTLSRTQLKFRYEFEAADGTRIQIRAKANLSFKQSSDGDETTQSIKLSSKLRISTIQQSVSSGVGSLLESPAIPADAKNVISQALEMFQQLTDAATSSFLSGEPLDGDQLIQGLVAAFNELAGTIQPGGLPAPVQPVALTSGDVVAPPTDPIEALPLPAVASKPVTVTEPAESTGSAAPPAVEEAPSDVLPEEAVEASTAENEALPSLEQSGSAAATPQEQGVSAESPHQLVNSVMAKVRLRVVQSLTQLVGDFNSEATNLQLTQSTLRVSARFVAQGNFGGPVVNEASPQGEAYDQQV